MLYGNRVGKEEQKRQKLMECAMHTQAKTNQLPSL